MKEAQPNGQNKWLSNSRPSKWCCYWRQFIDGPQPNLETNTQDEDETNEIQDKKDDGNL